jgi:hypothetical protein
MQVAAAIGIVAAIHASDLFCLTQIPRLTSKAFCFKQISAATQNRYALDSPEITSFFTEPADNDVAMQQRFALDVFSKMRITKHIAQHGRVRAVPGMRTLRVFRERRGAGF